MNHSEKMREIILVKYNPDWPKQFQNESRKIEQILGDNCHDIHHIGSTAIPGICAKPIIDILVEVNDISKVDALDLKFENFDYKPMGEYGIAGRRFYWKNTTKRTHHIHLFEKDNTEIKRHLAFRDYLIANPNTALGYSCIKLNLAKQFPNDIESYVNGKDSFVRMIDFQTDTAKQDQLKAKDNVELTSYDPNWKKLGIAEVDSIKEICKLPFEAIEHLGSTAIEDMTAKPLIDIFIAVKHIDEAEQWIKPLQSLGYLYYAENPDKTHHRYFKGMPPFGIQRTHHVHILEMGEDFKRRVTFRDLLRGNANLRRQYEELKFELAKKYPCDREAYTDGKGEFINKLF